MIGTCEEGTDRDRGGTERKGKEEKGGMIFINDVLLVDLATYQAGKGAFAAISAS